MNTAAIYWEDDLRSGIWPRSAMVWIIAFWTALLVIRPWEKMFPWMAPLRVELVYSILALAVLCLSGQVRVELSMQTIGIALWFFGLALSAAFAFDTAKSWDSLYIYLTAFAFFFVLTSAIRTPYQLLFTVACFVIGSGLFLAKSQVEYFIFGGHAFAMGVNRLQGDNLTWGNPNALATLALITLPFGLFLWQCREAFTQTWPGVWRKMYRIGMGLCLLIAVTSIILTNSRTGMVGFGAFVLLVVVSKQSLSRVLINLVGGLVLVSVIWLLMPQASRHRIQTIWAPVEGNADDQSAKASTDGRKIGVRLGREMFRRYPTTGVGLGNFIFYRKHYLDGGGLVAHNTFIAVLSETGAVGSAAFLFFLLGTFVNARRTTQLAKYVPDSKIELLAKLAVACRRSMILLLFSGLAHDYQDLAPLYWIAAYCLLASTLAGAIASNPDLQAEDDDYLDEEQWLDESSLLGRDLRLNQLH